MIFDDKNLRIASGWKDYELLDAAGGERLEHLDVVSVVMPPAAHLAVHILDFLIVRVHQPALVGFQLLIDPP